MTPGERNKAGENPQGITPYTGVGLPNGGEQTGAPTGGRRRRGRGKNTLKGGMIPPAGGSIGPMGGRRRRGSRGSRGKQSMKGGAWSTFSAGPYANPATVSDGMVGSVNLDGGATPSPLVGSYLDGNPFAADSPRVAMSGGKRRRGSRKNGKAASRNTRKSKRPMSPWLEHVMAVKKENPSFSLGDAMKAAKKTYKK